MSKASSTVKQSNSNSSGASQPIQLPIDERALLGTLVRFDDLSDKKRAELRPVLEGLSHEFFVDVEGTKQCSQLAKCICRLRDEGREINIDSVSEWLASHGSLQSPADRKFIDDLTPGLYPADHLCRVKDAYIARHVRRAAMDLEESIHSHIRFTGEAVQPAEIKNWIGQFGGESPELHQAIRDTVSKMEDLLSSGETRRGARPKDRIGSRHERILNKNADVKSGKRPEGIRTCMPSLDAVLGHLEPSLIMLAAWQGIGKSSLMRKWALGMASRTDTKKRGVVIFSMEMPADEMMDVLIYTVAGVDGSKLDRMESFTAEEEERITLASNTIAGLPIHIEDEETLPDGVLTPRLMESITRRVARDFAADGIELAAVMIDYLQMCELDEKNKMMSRENEIRKIAYDCKKSATRLRVPVIALAQLNEAGKDRGDGRPRAEDMRESKGIVQAAHKVVLIHNPNYSKRSTQVAGTSGSEPEYVELIVGKNRSGKTGLVEARFLPETTTFLDTSEMASLFAAPVIPLPDECALPPDFTDGDYTGGMFGEDVPFDA